MYCFDRRRKSRLHLLWSNRRARVNFHSYFFKYIQCTFLVIWAELCTLINKSKGYLVIVVLAMVILIGFIIPSLRSRRCIVLNMSVFPYVRVSITLHSFPGHYSLQRLAIFTHSSCRYATCWDYFLENLEILFLSDLCLFFFIYILASKNFSYTFSQ